MKKHKILPSVLAKQIATVWNNGTASVFHDYCESIFFNQPEPDLVFRDAVSLIKDKDAQYKMIDAIYSVASRKKCAANDKGKELQTFFIVMNGDAADVAEICAPPFHIIDKIGFAVSESGFVCEQDAHVLLYPSHLFIEGSACLTPCELRTLTSGGIVADDANISGSQPMIDMMSGIIGEKNIHANASFPIASVVLIGVVKSKSCAESISESNMASSLFESKCANLPVKVYPPIWTWMGAMDLQILTEISGNVCEAILMNEIAMQSLFSGHVHYLNEKITGVYFHIQYGDNVVGTIHMRPEMAERCPSLMTWLEKFSGFTSYGNIYEYTNAAGHDRPVVMSY